MGRGVEACFVAGELEDFCAFGRNRAFAVGAGDVERGEDSARRAETLAGFYKAGKMAGSGLLQEEVEAHGEKILLKRCFVDPRAAEGNAWPDSPWKSEPPLISHCFSLTIFSQRFSRAG